MIAHLKQKWLRLQIWWCEYNLAIIDEARRHTYEGEKYYLARMMQLSTDLKGDS